PGRQPSPEQMAQPHTAQPPLLLPPPYRSQSVAGGLVPPDATARALLLPPPAHRGDGLSHTSYLRVHTPQLDMLVPLERPIPAPAPTRILPIGVARRCVPWLPPCAVGHHRHPLGPLAARLLVGATQRLVQPAHSNG